MKCPDRVGFVGAQLHTLNLSNNNLSELPEEIGCLLGLQHLDLHNNCISYLPVCMILLKPFVIALDVLQLHVHLASVTCVFVGVTALLIHRT